MTARWQPLITAEEVVEAFRAERLVQFTPGYSYAGKDFWRDVLADHCCGFDGDESGIRVDLSVGARYRALVEGGEGGAE